MKRAHRLYLFRNKLVVFALISFFFNLILGLLLFLPLVVPWKGIVLGIDVLIMLFVTVSLIGPLALSQGEEKIRRAQLPPVARRSRSRIWVERLPKDVWGKVAVIGVSAAIVAMPFILSTLHFLGDAGYSLNQLVLVRAGLSALAAGLLAALFAWIGLVDASS